MQRQQSTSKPTRVERDLQRRRRPAPTTAPRAPGEALLRLQSVAGNQAVARLLDEREAGPPPAPAAATPAAPTASPEAPKRPWWRRALGRLADAAKERLLRPLAGIASKVPGYGLLAFALGRDPISGAAVERGGNALLKAVVQLIPGGGAVMASIEQSGALQRAGTWLSTEVPKLGLTWEAIGGLFARAFKSLKLTDVFSPAAAWERLAGIFGPPLARLRAFASAALGKLRELAFEAALAMGGGLAGQVMAVLRRGGSVLGSIFANPIGFAGNLIGAVRGGLGRFAANIGSHLKTGLFGWLFGALRGVIELPQRIDLRGVGSVVLQLLGLTWGRLRERLVVRLGAPRVSFIERSVDFVRRIATEGLPAVWEKILEFASGLTDTVIGGIREWVTNSIVGAAVAKLVTMFNPAGALIQAILSIYRAVQWLIQQAHQLGALATSIFDSLAAIASGSIGGAITAVENALARTLPVVISFLAGQLGLGNIGEHVRGVVNRVRAVVERAMARVVEFLATRFARVMGRGRQRLGGGDDWRPQSDGSIEDPRAVAQAMVANRLRGEFGATTAHEIVRDVGSRLAPHGLKRLEIGQPDGEGAQPVIAEASPPLVIAKLVAPKRSNQVRMTATMKIAGSSPLDSLDRPDGGFRFGEYRRGGKGAPSVHASQIDPPHGQSNAGAALVKPESGSDELRVVAWNSGEPVAGSNHSHAEQQFIHYFQQQRRLGKHVTHLQIAISHSPCPHCCGALASFLTRAQGVRAALRYEEPYYRAPRNGRPGLWTTQDDIAMLREAGWEVTPGGKPVEATQPAPELRLEVPQLVGAFTRRAARKS